MDAEVGTAGTADSPVVVVSIFSLVASACWHCGCCCCWCEGGGGGGTEGICDEHEAVTVVDVAVVKYVLRRSKSARLNLKLDELGAAVVVVVVVVGGVVCWLFASKIVKKSLKNKIFSYQNLVKSKPTDYLKLKTVVLIELVG